MKRKAIFPVTFARVDGLGGDYVAMNMSEYRWPNPFSDVVMGMAKNFTRVFRRS
jgi:hypothetical protein